MDLPKLLPKVDSAIASNPAQEALVFASEPQFYSGPWTNLLQQPSDSVVLASSLRPISANTVQEALPLGVAEKKITEPITNTPIRDVIPILSPDGEHKVIFDDTAGGDVSVNIKDATFDEALAEVLAPLGLCFSLEQGTYYVAPPDPDAALYSKISKRYQYEPLHHDVKDILSLLPARYKKFVDSSENRNLILIDAPPELGQDIMSRIREIDTPVMQIELEAIVCVTAPDSGFRFGLDWNHMVGINGVDSIKAGMTGLSFSGSSGTKNAFTDFAVTSTFVRLLENEGYITIRAQPRVTTKDGVKASFSINRETYFSLQGPAANAFFSPTIQKVEAGINLDVTPILRGDMISVSIKGEVSEYLPSSEAVPNSNQFPSINRRVVSTNVNVPEGHTIVIGGLVQRQTVERINRIPILSRIPLAGKLFQTIEKQEQDTEVAIFLSPKLVLDGHACKETHSFNGTLSEPKSQSP